MYLVDMPDVDGAIRTITDRLKGCIKPKSLKRFTSKEKGEVSKLFLTR